MRKEADREIGIAEDITTSYLERQRIEHERDYDVLTGLYNRFSFQRHMDYLFEHSEQLKNAALVMIDLDNLKKINDAFGHDWGDNYIRQCGKCFQENVPEKTICARVSGDEFYLFLYGFDNQEEIRQRLISMTSIMQHRTVLLPNGNKMNLSASIGISWYPQNSVYFDFLKKYADFAMYQVKRSAKGNIQEFDPDVYNRNASEEQQRKQFRQLIRREELRYYYQPIVSAVTGKIYALEALMHVELSTLKSPEDVVRLAKEEKCLHELERITFFRAAEGYVQLRECGDVRGDELLFIKSIASESISNDECREFNRKYGDLQPQLVLEITEQESLNKKALEKKNMPGFLGAIALDDYGSGYNSEKSLLAISPQYIKVDMAIIRDIDIDPDKQQIVVNIVNYAHQRGMYIVAEGIETSAELEKVLELGVDLLQGYYLARPAAVPGEINSEAIKIIKNRSREV